jgi:hypothetical protein
MMMVGQKLKEGEWVIADQWVMEDQGCDQASKY